MTLTALAVVSLLVMFGAPALVKILAQLRRRRARRRMGDRALVREALALGGRIQLHRTPPLHGMQPGRSYLVTVDLLLATDKLIIASDRGLIADLGRNPARLALAVSPGPQRLLIEGRIPVPGRPDGRYRLQLVVEHAAAWADSLQAFVRSSGREERAPARPDLS